MGSTNSKTNPWQTNKLSMIPNYMKKNSRVYSREDFLQLLHYERVRSDRSEAAFSLVVFEIGGHFPDKKQLENIITTITGNVRAIDHVGWFEDSIGVILPATCKDSAVKFARAIRRRAFSEVIPFSIYSYPDHSSDAFAVCGESGQTTNIYDPSGSGRLCISERLKSVFTAGVPVWKRSLDIFGSLCGIVVLLPFLVLLATYIKIVSRGPVLYRSRRIGLKGESFTFLKFRTMHAENNQTVHSSHAVDFIRNDKSMDKLDDHDPRIIPVRSVNGPGISGGNRFGIRTSDRLGASDRYRSTRGRRHRELAVVPT